MEPHFLCSDGRIARGPRALSRPIAGVIGVPSKKWGESPLAVIVKSADVSPEDVMAFCNGKLAPYKAIKVVEFVDVIPRNPSGKILKRVLREQYAEIELD